MLKWLLLSYVHPIQQVKMILKFSMFAMVLVLHICKQKPCVECKCDSCNFNLNETFANSGQCLGFVNMNLYGTYSCTHRPRNKD
jgi:hypothetical protein